MLEAGVRNSRSFGSGVAWVGWLSRSASKASGSPVVVYHIYTVQSRWYVHSNTVPKARVGPTKSFLVSHHDYRLGQ
jgi:hypothetical protein